MLEKAKELVLKHKVPLLVAACAIAAALLLL
jgi:hypothetical protein